MLIVSLSARDPLQTSGEGVARDRLGPLFIIALRFLSQPTRWIVSASGHITPNEVVTKSAGHVDREQVKEEPPSALGHQRDMPAQEAV